MLVVEAPPGRVAERRWILDVVLADWLGLQWRLEQHDRGDVRIRLDGDPGGRAVTLPDTLLGIDDDRWLTPSSLPTDPLPVLTVDDPGSTPLRRGERIPVLYGASAPAVRVVHDEEGARVPVDVFGTAFAALARYEEAVVPDRDRYGRFPARASLAAREGLLTRPVVDACVEVLWSAFERVWPRLPRTAHAYRVLLTHDVDDPVSTWGRGPIDVALQVGADVVRRRDAGLAARRVRALLTRAPDPHDTFGFLMDVSERHGLTSAFYFQAHHSADPRDGALYPMEHPRIRDLLGTVHARGHEVGYHAGFGTHLDAARTAAEFDLLRTVAERQGVHQERWGGRQHYLQWAVGSTWRNWSDAGLDYDCTLAYADAVGFRTGTSREYQAFDVVGSRALALRERPFQVMDVTLFDYMGLPAGAASEAVLDIAAQCRRFRGTLGILWHNDSVLRTARQKRWYASMIEAVAPGG